MTDAKLPLIHKAPVEELVIHVARTGLSIGDTAWLDRTSEGRVGVYAQLRQPILGFIPRLRPGLVGHLGPLAEEIVSPSLAHGDDLRVRIIDLVPEHLANGYPPEVYISVWGDPRHLQPVLQLLGEPSAPAAAEPAPGATSGPGAEANGKPPGAARARPALRPAVLARG
jgi:hypothetical protein